MEKIDASFWMGNRLATECVEISTDPASLNKPGFWAVVNTFEGNWICARFAKVIDAPLPQSTWQIKEKIAQGDIYQVNLCRILTTDCDQSLLGLAGRVQQSNPAPYASYLKLPNLEIASASPELFLERSGKRIKSTPIKGTATSDAFGEKDKAENVMIVDLMRNDFGSICEIGSVDVPRLLATQEHPGLFHLVSDVVGTLRSDINWENISEHLLPAGSISGAPKSSALKTIAQIEQVARGPYCGVIGWVEGDKALLSVGIRIFWSENDGKIHFGTGAGITWQSEPNQEWEETQLKAKRLTAIASGVLV
ncbi:MAG: chorismate-binding protein [Actinobacteria bacterium]|nr:chorismate-binding protein [Actinomycetota bacterium]